jgi:hypothetical protein
MVSLGSVVYMLEGWSNVARDLDLVFILHTGLYLPHPENDEHTSDLREIGQVRRTAMSRFDWLKFSVTEW